MAKMSAEKIQEELDKKGYTLVDAIEYKNLEVLLQLNVLKDILVRLI